MNDETAMWRPAPPSRYVPTGKVLMVPEPTLARTVASLRTSGNVESTCLWLGILHDDGNAEVQAIVAPKQTNRPRSYLVSGDAMLEVADLARAHRWTVVGAIHSHPGVFVEHSTYDDEMTPSRRAASIVVPCYGHWSGPWPRGLGVHEYFERYWHLLSEEQARQRVALFNAPETPMFDLR